MDATHHSEESIASVYRSSPFLKAVLSYPTSDCSCPLPLCCVNSFLTSDLLGLHGDFVALFLVYFVLLHTVADWLLRASADEHTLLTSVGPRGGSPVPWWGRMPWAQRP